MLWRLTLKQMREGEKHNVVTHLSKMIHTVITLNAYIPHTDTLILCFIITVPGVIVENESYQAKFQTASLRITITIKSASCVSPAKIGV